MAEVDLFVTDSVLDLIFFVFLLSSILFGLMNFLSTFSHIQSDFPDFHSVVFGGRMGGKVRKCQQGEIHIYLVQLHIKYMYICVGIHRHTHTQS